MVLDRCFARNAFQLIIALYRLIVIALHNSHLCHALAMGDLVHDNGRIGE